MLMILSFLIFNLSAQTFVSSSPAVTETLYYLGAQNSLVAVSDYCTYPLAAKKLPRIGSSFGLKYEKLISLKPDLIILQKLNDQKTKEELSKLKIKNIELSFN